MNIDQKKERIFIFGALIATIVLFFGFGFHHLTKFVTADEHYWIYERVPQYWKATADGNFKKTLINDKPGITVALISGAGLLWEKNPETLCHTTEEKIITCDTGRTERILLAFRLPIIFANILLIIYLFWITKKITNGWIALWSTILTALSPMLLGMSQIINPDSLLWSFGMAAILSYFALLRFQESKYVFLSGLFLALALLTKYVAGILIPFFILTLMVWSVFKVAPASEREEALKIIRKNILFLFFVVFLATFIFSILLPAAWIKPSILQNIFSGGSGQPLYLASLISFSLIFSDIFLWRGRFFFFFCSLVKKMKPLGSLKRAFPLVVLVLFSALALGRFFFPEWPLFERIPFDLKELTSDSNYYGPSPTLSEAVLLEVNPLIFSLPPIALFLFLFFLSPQSSAGSKKEDWDFETSILLFFLPIYFFALIFMDVLATPRYIIILYPIISFLAAAGAWKSRYFLKNNPFLSDASIALVILMSSLLSLNSARPFYTNYANFLLPQNNLVSSAWGYGGYEAAKYLNSLPEAEKLLVWSDYEGVCEFFVGSCMTKQYQHASSQTFDYAVITRRGEILYNPDHIRWQNKKNLNMVPAYKSTEPEWSLEINGRPENFVRVIKIAK